MRQDGPLAFPHLEMDVDEVPDLSRQFEHILAALSELSAAQRSGEERLLAEQRLVAAALQELRRSIGGPSAHASRSPAPRPRGPSGEQGISPRRSPNRQRVAFASPAHSFVVAGEAEGSSPRSVATFRSFAEETPRSAAAVDRCDELSLSGWQLPPAARPRETSSNISNTDPFSFDCWPAGMQMRPELRSLRQGVSEQKLRALVDRNQSAGLRSRLNLLSLSDESPEAQGSAGGAMQNLMLPPVPVHRLILHPNSGARLVIDVTSMALLVYDMILTPYALAWGTAFEGWLLAMSWLKLSYWTVDIGLSFITGYYTRGELEMRWYKIAKHYFQTFFVIDVFIVVCDWISMMFTITRDSSLQSTSSVNLVRFAKATRLLRVIAVLRVIRVAGLFENAMNMSLSDSLRTFMQVLKLFFGILWVTHVMSCAWYAIGTSAQSDTGKHWVSFSRVGDERSFDELSDTFLYVTSFHWSIIQIATGSMEIMPMNTIERIFTIACLLLGLAIGCSLVSSISATVLHAQTVKQDYHERLRTLRQYLRQSGIDPKLSVRVLRQFTERTNKKDMLADSDVLALGCLLPTLRIELQCEIFAPQLKAHPLFRVWSNLHHPAIQRLCWEALSFEYLLPLDSLFICGSEADSAFRLVAGKLEYSTCGTGSSHLGDSFLQERGEATKQIIVESAWLCEATLWVPWVHVGELVALTRCQLLAVNAKAALAVMQSHDLIRDITLEYARCFHAHLIAAIPPAAELPSDVEVPFTEYSEIVSGMRPEFRALIGQMALERSTSWLGRTSRLASVVGDGLATVIEDGDGEVLHVVLLSTLRLERNDGRILVCLAKAGPDGLRAGGQLPSAEQKSGELPRQAAQRILTTQLTAVAGDVSFTSSSRDVFARHSKEFGVSSKHIHTVHRAEVVDGSLLSSADIVPGRGGGTPQGHARGRRRSLIFAGNAEGPLRLGDLAPFTIRDEAGQSSVYTWMTPDEVERLETLEGEQLVQQWSVHLDMQNRSGALVQVGHVRRPSDSPAESALGTERPCPKAGLVGTQSRLAPLPLRARELPQREHKFATTI